MAGAEKLLGKGDMLFYPAGATKPTRVQGAFISDKEVEKVVDFVKANGEATYNDDILEQIERVNSTDKEIEEQQRIENEKLKAQIKDICPILIKGSIEEARKTKEA